MASSPPPSPPSPLPVIAESEPQPQPQPQLQPQSPPAPPSPQQQTSPPSPPPQQTPKTPLPPPPPQQSKLALILGPALDRIVKAVAWRKHSKLVQACKAAAEKLSALSVPAADGNGEEEGGGGLGVLFDGSKFLPSSQAEIVLEPLIAALDAGSAKVAEAALDAIQKMISYGFLRGEVDMGNPNPNPNLSPNPNVNEESKLLGLLVDGVCKCYDLDNSVELLVLKTLLTAVTSTHLRIHGESLLKAVRTCYNIYLASKAAVNQTTAKASLTQMLVIVFRRMEADSSTVPVHPIVVADLMEPAERSASDSNMTQFVQTFITKVLQDIEVVLNPPLASLRSMGHEGAFSAAPTESSDPTNLLESSDKDMLDAKYWEITMYKNALEERKGELADADPDRDGDQEVHITNKLRRDAFLIFRALCKLSMNSVSLEGASDPLVLRGKVVALELLKILLENAGAVFRTSERFLGAIKQYLCLSLLKNIASSIMNIFQLSCSIFMSLVSRFRAGLKAEIGVFFPMIVLRVLENVTQPDFSQKTIVLRFLEKICIDSQILVDIFLNYDCDVESSNIFERMVNGLLKTAQGVPPNAVTSLTPVQDGTLKLTAMKCLVGVLRSMGDWMNRQLRITDNHFQKTSDLDDTSSESTSSISNNVRGGIEEASEASEVSSEAASETSEAATFEQRRAYKLELQEGILQFNKKPQKGIAFLKKNKKVGDSPEEVANFLQNASGLDKTMVGDYLGENEEFALKVMHAYVDSFDFQGMEFDEAIRTLLAGFRLPGEAQKIDRIMEKFAERYCKCNPKRFTSADTAYVLAYSVILLNTDAHNPQVKNKMSKAGFLRNNRGIDDGNDLPEEFLGALYDRIGKREIKMKDTNLFQQSTQISNANKILGLDAILNIVIRKRTEETILETSDDVIRHMQEQFKAKTGKSDSIYYAASDVEILRPMVEVVWAPMLAAFSIPLDQSDDEVVTFQCLEGFRHAVHITTVTCMRTQRDVFLNSLAKFTSLHSAADIKQKNIDAIKAIIAIADEDGNFLQDAWEPILTCVSRFENLHLLGEGSPPDATFFAANQNDVDKSRQSPRASVLPALKKGWIFTNAPARRGSYDSAGVGGHAAGSITNEQMNNLVNNLNMLEQIGSFEMNRIFTRSVRLNSEAIVDFVRALCKVSLEELRSPTDPRVFSLTKIVEISHFNMDRIRLVWSRIWHVLSDFFINIGCSDNLSIAIFAMDSLRQLAMKFLEREELAYYNFQNEFMKPFVIVMRKSRAMEIRELIIRCVSQMVLARVNNIKSGWKIVFMVFTTAATDDHKNIVLLAFETIERIVREYFPYITETETTTFTDCVNCLIAFTNNRFNKDISLNAIAFLRFCALKLAEGELGAVAKDSDKNKGKPAPGITDKDDHLYFWFPLLAGLSELTFDPRPDIRKSALEVLFDTLRNHGHLFSPGLWEKVFDSVLFPIFDYVRRETDPYNQKPQGSEWDREDNEVEVDVWLYETCTLALQLVVDLFVKFYADVNPLLGKISLLLTGFIKRSHQSLAGIGVAAFVRLIGSAGNLFSDENWYEVLSSLKEAAAETLPDLSRIVLNLDAQPPTGVREAGTISHLIGKENNSAANIEQASREGAARDLLRIAIGDVKSRTAVQLLLVQAVSEIYNSHDERLTAGHMKLLLDALHEMAVHAHKLNGDFVLRSRLRKLQAITQMPDPPLLRLESEAYQAYLSLLQHLPTGKPTLAKDVDVETRLVELCEEVLQVYLNTADDRAKEGGSGTLPLWIIPLGSSRRRELVSRAPLVVSTLQVISSLNDTSFEKHLTRFFPLLANLVCCEHGSGEVQIALSDMFSSWIGPILMRATR